MTREANRAVAAAEARLRAVCPGGFAAVHFDAERYPSHPAIEVADPDGERSVAVFVAQRCCEVHIWRPPRLDGDSGTWVRVQRVRLTRGGRGWPERLGQMAADLAAGREVAP